MGVNAHSKRVAEISDLPVKNPDGSPMRDDNGNAVTATVFGPGTKIWQAANAARKRKAMQRTRENGGKIEAAFDNEDEDKIEFLSAVTKRFNNFDYPDVQGEREQVRAIYNDPMLGFIRDHLDDDARNWGSFTQPSSTN